MVVFMVSWKKSRGRSGSPTVALITDAHASRHDNYEYRKRTYSLLQWSRIPLLLACGATIMWSDWYWLATILLVVSVPMPWIAVVIANGHGEKADKRAPRVYKPALVRQQNYQWAQERLELARQQEAEAEQRQLESRAAEGVDLDSEDYTWEEK